MHLPIAAAIPKGWSWKNGFHSAVSTSQSHHLDLFHFVQWSCEVPINLSVFVLLFLVLFIIIIIYHYHYLLWRASRSMSSPQLFCQFSPKHLSALLSRLTPCLMSHVIQLPIGAFRFSLLSYLAASFPIISPRPCVHNTNVFINTNGCKLGFLTNILMFSLVHPSSMLEWNNSFVFSIHWIHLELS